ncbi:gas vesicle protein [Streptomyces sp. HPF1205]|uniref:gas vesicle protein n=1 Tax=Streptomyces sp. HPF1205 TaxID=2873262 RepID=UPI001CEDAED1|nr:gas vesicle protein [Streptomyces sp. HPF1205]
MPPAADPATAPPSGPFAARQVALVDLLDRLLAGGVVIAGELTLRIADVDLVRIHLRALITSIGPQARASREGDTP